MPPDRKSRIMVVNDSMLLREFLSEIVTSHPSFELCGTARDGEDALSKLASMNPDVILLDLEMPNMDGMTFIERVMRERPRAIIAVSAYAEYGGGDIVFDSLDMGAVDFMAIPSAGLHVAENLKAELIAKIDLAGKIDPSQIVPRNRISHSHGQEGAEPSKISASRIVVVIGASTGGPRVISELLSKLPKDLPACVLVVQHMPPSFTKTFAQHLNGASSLTVKEACDGDPLKDGVVYIAPGDFHTMVMKGGTIKLTKAPKIHGVRPSVNISMVTASEVFGPTTIGVLLTGMGQDGAFGMKMIKRRGGMTIAQDQSTSIVYGMPRAAVELGAVDESVPSNLVAELVCRYTERAKREVLRHVG
jgi:two-component system, chemotaxis family, protein-glutamate methylesterase/glutaminase